MQVSEQRHRAGPSIHQTPYPADAGVQAVHHGVADRPRYRDNACAPQGAGAVDGEGRRGRSDAPDPQGVRIGRVARSTQRTLARDPKRCNRTPISPLWLATRTLYSFRRPVTGKARTVRLTAAEWGVRAAKRPAGVRGEAPSNYFAAPRLSRFASSWYAPVVPAGSCRQSPSPT